MIETTCVATNTFCSHVMIPSASGFTLAGRETTSDLQHAVASSLIQSAAVGTNKWRLHALCCQLSCLVPYFLQWLHLFVLNKTIKTHLKRLRWERGGLSPSISISRTSWLSLAKSCISIQSVTLGVRRMLTDYNWGIHKETASGSRGITTLHLMCTQPKCQTRGWKARCIYKPLLTKDTMSFVIHPQNQFRYRTTCISPGQLYITI